jgi:hypothetical protein
MLTAALINFRRRAYGDALAGLQSVDAQEIFESLAADQTITQALRKDRLGEERLDPEGEIRKDAQTLAGFARELEHVMTEVYEEPFPDLKMANGEIVDLDTSVSDGAETFRWYVFSGTSVARLSSAYSSGTSPGTAITAAAVLGNVECLENHYEYSFRDLRNAAFAGVPLEPMLASKAKRAHEELLNDILLWGREDVGLPGFLTHPNITITRAPADGTGSSRAWEDKSIDLILRDIRLLIDTPGEVSHGMRETTDVLFSREEERLLTSLRMGTGDGTLTVMQFLRQTYPEVRFGRLLELAASKSRGNLATNSALAYVRKRDVLRGVVPMAFRQYPPERAGLKVRVDCESSTGGMIVKEPMTIHRLDDVGAS